MSTHTTSSSADDKTEAVVVAVRAVDDELIDAFNRLIPQLSSSSPPPSHDHLTALVSSEDTVLFVARIDGRILGSLTLAFYRIPTGTKAWIEERGRMLRAAVATRCDNMPDGAECRSDGSCLTHSCPAGMRCEQGSIGPMCISGMDACGCAAGSGWSGTLQPGCCRCGSRTKPGSLPPVAPR